MSEAAVRVGMAPSHPGEFVREEVLAPLGLSASDAAAALGVSQGSVSELLDMTVPLSPEMALRIEKAFGVDMDMMLRIQAWHDAHAMRQRAGEIDVKPFTSTKSPGSASA